jgi:hypothetical protein
MLINGFIVFEIEIQIGYSNIFFNHQRYSFPKSSVMSYGTGFLFWSRNHGVLYSVILKIYLEELIFSILSKCFFLQR